MRLSANRGKRIGGFALGLVAILVACFLIVPYMLSTLGAQPKEGPPDLGYELSRCTRVEIEFEPSTLEYFFPGDEERALLSGEERRALESLKTITSKSLQDIKDLAVYDLTMGYYTGRARGDISIKNRIHVVGYRDDKRVISFRIIGTLLRTDDGYEFRYDKGLPHLRALMPQVWPFALRVGCEVNLSQLGNVLSEMSETRAFPPATQWCDAVLRHNGHLNSPGSSPSASVFECPGARTCHYAMNRDWRPDAAGDIVLLFETNAGWNQHGGPELFTFDNHDPKGGLVLLNDGTVKFIRNGEELKQLRWK